MKKPLLNITVCMIVSTLSICKLSAQHYNVSNKLVPYLDFIKTTNTTPVDYVFSLFQKYDIVILGERDHRDTTQYELICQIISDPRFHTQVKNILTEIGNTNYSKKANQLIQTSWKNDSIFQQHLISLLQNITSTPFWEKYNFPKLLTHLYRCNLRLTNSTKINLYLTDIKFSWDSINTPDDYHYFEITQLKYRDSIMSNNAIKILESILEKREKALIIYNEPHARICKSNKTTSAAFYISQHFPERVANIRINDVEFSTRDTEKSDRLIAHGKWDAAFEISSNKSIGFNLKSSPFGKEKFHSLRNRKLQNVRWEDVYTGFIYYQPFYKWTSSIGYPNVITEKFEKELYRRYTILQIPNVNIHDLKKYNTLQNQPIYSRKLVNKLRKIMKRYYKPGTEKGK